MGKRTNIIIGVTAVAATPLLAVCSVPAALGVFGFSAGGVIAGNLPSFLELDPNCSFRLTTASGSAAATAQAGIGNVAAGSVFAFFQSAAAGGAATAVVNGLVGGTAAVAAAGAAAPRLIKSLMRP
ncbi:hypothetical protein K491DRAFT_694121 [Lophiostoma macrostomum CBS 122681]|uniref:Uncharacterized protein n=1 Tax=Lophiostoma macrostomum CBS 122681 TaxID=1314788 RepID=A0A6A6T1R8_9PLEO|nr:hypothetical protein K491DRAFT_694121 [Lophiostoma macrostomum CBS 122681]